MPFEFDPSQLPDSFYEDPYPVYADLRAQSPVHVCPDGSIYLTRHEDIFAVYRDPRLYSSDKKVQFAPVFGEDSPLYEHHTTSLVFNDPPLHTHVRKAIGNALSQKIVDEMERGLETLVAGLLDRIEQKGSADLVADYAAAIPVEIIGNLLKVPQEEREPLRRWSLAILGGLEANLSDEAKTAGEQSVVEFLAYLDHFVGQRRQSLQSDDDDILARLLRWESDGVRLSTLELYHQCIFLLNAGHETTSNLIGNGIELLLRYPDQRADLMENPGLIGSAVEEMLRYESPNQLGNRTATQAVEVGGLNVAADTVLTLCIGSANRDESVFVDPEQFDITRSPNRHLAFGSGIHTCAGLNVARLEGKVAILRFFERFPRVELNGQPERARRARFRGFASLPVVI